MHTILIPHRAPADHMCNAMYNFPQVWQEHDAKSIYNHTEQHCSSMLFEAPGQTARALCGGAETLDFAIVNVKGIQQILPTTTLKPANVNLLSNWRAITFLTKSKLRFGERMTLRFM